MNQVREQEQNGIEPNKPPDKQANYRSYFLRMYLKIAHICKTVKTLMTMNARFLKSFTCSTVRGLRKVVIVLKITLCNIIILPKNKAQVPKNRPSNFFCFCINSLFIPEFNKELKHMSQPNFILDKRLKPNPIKARISHRNSVPFRYLNTMIIQPKYNSPSSDVVSSNAPPLHRDGSRPIGGFLLGD